MMNKLVLGKLLNSICIVLAIFSLVVGVYEKEQNYKVPEYKNLDYSYGVLTVYQPGRSGSRFKVKLQEDYSAICCFLFNGWYSLLKKHENKKVGIYWAYIEGLDRKVGFEVHLLNKDGESIKLIRSYRRTIEGFNRWSSQNYSSFYYYLSFCFLIVFIGTLKFNKGLVLCLKRKLSKQGK